MVQNYHCARDDGVGSHSTLFVSKWAAHECLLFGFRRLATSPHAVRTRRALVGRARLSQFEKRACLLRVGSHPPSLAAQPSAGRGLRINNFFVNCAFNVIMFGGTAARRALRCLKEGPDSEAYFRSLSLPFLLLEEVVPDGSGCVSSLEASNPQQD